MTDAEYDLGSYRPLLRLEVGMALLMVGALWIEVSGWPEGLPLSTVAVLFVVQMVALWEIIGGFKDYWRGYNVQ